MRKKIMRNILKKNKLLFILVILMLLFCPTILTAQPGLDSSLISGLEDTTDADQLAENNSSTGLPIPKIPFVEEADDPEEVGTALSIILLLSILSLAPSIIVLFTSFIRIAIVFSFTRTALATQQVPPNQVLYALALVLTFFIMAPVFTQIYDNAYLPYQEGDINLEEFGELSMEPIREFMFKQMGSDNARRSLKIFVELANIPNPKTHEDVPLHVLVPAFVLNELTTAFEIGVLIFIPFIIIDLVVSSVLLSIGIIFLPPIIVSLPIKITIFVLVDGWNLLVENLIKGFL